MAQDTFWSSPTVRSVILTIIAGLLSIIVWFFNWFTNHFDERMRSVEDDVKATKSVVIKLAVRQGVAIDSLTLERSTIPKKLPLTDHGYHPAFLAVKAKELEDLLAQ